MVDNGVRERPVVILAVEAVCQVVVVPAYTDRKGEVGGKVRKRDHTACVPLSANPPFVRAKPSARGV